MSLKSSSAPSCHPQTAKSGEAAPAPRNGDRFAPGRDGVIGIYALRVIDRGEDPRHMVAAHCATRYGIGPSRTWRHGTPPDVPTVAVGRLSPALAPARPAPVPVPVPAGTIPTTARPVKAAPARFRRLSLPSMAGVANFIFGQPEPTRTRHRRMVTAGLALVLLTGPGALDAGAQEASTGQTYIVQAGDTVASIAAAFGVDPVDLAAASGLEDIDVLAPGESLVIPGPELEPTSLVAATDDAPNEMTDSYVVAEGDTVAAIASWFGVPLDALLAENGITDPEQLAVGELLWIPVLATDAALETPVGELAAFEGGSGVTDDALAAAPIAPAIEISGVPNYQQSFPLSSEYAAAFIATSAFGAGIPESVFIDAVPLSENPHWGYRGNLAGDWGNTTDYGVYPEAIAPVLNANGFQTDLFYANGDATALVARLDAGMPVIAWLGFYGDTAFTVPTADGGAFDLAAGMRAVVIYGYDADGVLVSDPQSGSYQRYDWESFLAAWNILDGMSLAIAPY